MSNETELRSLQRLEREGEVARTQVPASIQKGNRFRQFLEAGILREVSRGSGSCYRVEQPEALREILDHHFPGRHEKAEATAVGNLHRLRDTKGGSRESTGVVLLRGNGPIRLNGHAFALGEATQRYGLAACRQPTIGAKRVCLVENLDSFLQAEDLLGLDWTLLHTYGRLGNTTLSGLQAERILHFGDYDFTGLNEYLKLKRLFPKAALYVPEELERSWETYSRPLKRGATATPAVIRSRERPVVRIRELLRTTGRFLEQQALFIGLNATS